MNLTNLFKTISTTLLKQLVAPTGNTLDDYEEYWDDTLTKQNANGIYAQTLPCKKSDAPILQATIIHHILTHPESYPLIDGKYIPYIYVGKTIDVYEIKTDSSVENGKLVRVKDQSIYKKVLKQGGIIHYDISDSQVGPNHLMGQHDLVDSWASSISTDGQRHVHPNCRFLLTGPQERFPDFGTDFFRRYPVNRGTEFQGALLGTTLSPQIKLMDGSHLELDGPPIPDYFQSRFSPVSSASAPNVTAMLKADISGQKHSNVVDLQGDDGNLQEYLIEKRLYQSTDGTVRWACVHTTLIQAIAEYKLTQSNPYLVIRNCPLGNPRAQGNTPLLRFINDTLTRGYIHCNPDPTRTLQRALDFFYGDVHPSTTTELQERLARCGITVTEKQLEDFDLELIAREDVGQLVAELERIGITQTDAQKGKIIIPEEFKIVIVNGYHPDEYASATAKVTPSRYADTKAKFKESNVHTITNTNFSDLFGLATIDIASSTDTEPDELNRDVIKHCQIDRTKGLLSQANEETYFFFPSQLSHSQWDQLFMALRQFPGSKTFNFVFGDSVVIPKKYELDIAPPQPDQLKVLDLEDPTTLGSTGAYLVETDDVYATAELLQRHYSATHVIQSSLLMRAGDVSATVTIEEKEETTPEGNTTLRYEATWSQSDILTLLQQGHTIILTDFGIEHPAFQELQSLFYEQANTHVMGQELKVGEGRLICIGKKAAHPERLRVAYPENAYTVPKLTDEHLLALTGASEEDIEEVTNLLRKAAALIYKDKESHQELFVATKLTYLFIMNCLAMLKLAKRNGSITENDLSLAFAGIVELNEEQFYELYNHIRCNHSAQSEDPVTIDTTKASYLVNKALANLTAPQDILTALQNSAWELASCFSTALIQKLGESLNPDMVIMITLAHLAQEDPNWDLLNEALPIAHRPEHILQVPLYQAPQPPTEQELQERKDQEVINLFKSPEHPRVVILSGASGIGKGETGSRFETRDGVTTYGPLSLGKGTNIFHESEFIKWLNAPDDDELHILRLDELNALADGTSSQFRCVGNMLLIDGAIIRLRDNQVILGTINPFHTRYDAQLLRESSTKRMQELTDQQIQELVLPQLWTLETLPHHHSHTQVMAETLLATFRAVNRILTADPENTTGFKLTLRHLQAAAVHIAAALSADIPPDENALIEFTLNVAASEFGCTLSDDSYNVLVQWAHYVYATNLPTDTGVWTTLKPENVANTSLMRRTRQALGNLFANRDAEIEGKLDTVPGKKLTKLCTASGIPGCGKTFAVNLTLQDLGYVGLSEEALDQIPLDQITSDPASLIKILKDLRERKVPEFETLTDEQIENRKLFVHITGDKDDAIGETIRKVIELGVVLFCDEANKHKSIEKYWIAVADGINTSGQPPRLKGCICILTENAASDVKGREETDKAVYQRGPTLSYPHIPLPDLQQMARTEAHKTNPDLTEAQLELISTTIATLHYHFEASCRRNFRIFPPPTMTEFYSVVQLAAKECNKKKTKALEAQIWNQIVAVYQHYHPLGAPALTTSKLKAYIKPIPLYNTALALATALQCPNSHRLQPADTSANVVALLVDSQEVDVQPSFKPTETLRVQHQLAKTYKGSLPPKLSQGNIFIKATSQQDVIHTIQRLVTKNELDPITLFNHFSELLLSPPAFDLNIGEISTALEQAKIKYVLIIQGRPNYYHYTAPLFTTALTQAQTLCTQLTTEVPDHPPALQKLAAAKIYKEHENQLDQLRAYEETTDPVIVSNPSKLKTGLRYTAAGFAVLFTGGLAIPVYWLATRNQKVIPTRVTRNQSDTQPEQPTRPTTSTTTASAPTTQRRRPPESPKPKREDDKPEAPPTKSRTPKPQPQEEQTDDRRSSTSSEEATKTPTPKPIIREEDMPEIFHIPASPTTHRRQDNPNFSTGATPQTTPYDIKPTYVKRKDLKQVFTVSKAQPQATRPSLKHLNKFGNYDGYMPEDGLVLCTSVSAVSNTKKLVKITSPAFTPPSKKEHIAVHGTKVGLSTFSCFEQDSQKLCTVIPTKFLHTPVVAMPNGRLLINYVLVQLKDGNLLKAKLKQHDLQLILELPCPPEDIAEIKYELRTYKTPPPKALRSTVTQAFEKGPASIFNHAQKQRAQLVQVLQRSHGTLFVEYERLMAKKGTLTYKEIEDFGIQCHALPEHQTLTLFHLLECHVMCATGPETLGSSQVTTQFMLFSPEQGWIPLNFKSQAVTANLIHEALPTPSKMGSVDGTKDALTEFNLFQEEFYDQEEYSTEGTKVDVRRLGSAVSTTMAVTHTNYVPKVLVLSSIPQANDFHANNDKGFLIRAFWSHMFQLHYQNKDGLPLNLVVAIEVSGEYKTATTYEEFLQLVLSQGTSEAPNALSSSTTYTECTSEMLDAMYAKFVTSFEESDDHVNSEKFKTSRNYLLSKKTDEELAIQYCPIVAMLACASVEPDHLTVMELNTRQTAGVWRDPLNLRALAHYTNLKTVKIETTSQTPITGLTGLGQLENLEELALHGINFENQDDQFQELLALLSKQKLTSLTLHVSLTPNQLEQLQRCLENQPQLHTLDIELSRTSREHSKAIARFIEALPTQLTTLKLGMLERDPVVLTSLNKSLPKLTQLTELELELHTQSRRDENPTLVFIRTLNGLPLQTLSLRGTMLFSEAMTALSFTTITALTLGPDAIAPRAYPSCCAKLRQEGVKELNLHGTRLTTNILASISGSNTTLKTLTITPDGSLSRRELLAIADHLTGTSVERVHIAGLTTKASAAIAQLFAATTSIQELSYDTKGKDSGENQLEFAKQLRAAENQTTLHFSHLVIRKEEARQIAEAITSSTTTVTGLNFEECTIEPSAIIILLKQLLQYIQTHSEITSFSFIPNITLPKAADLLEDLYFALELNRAFGTSTNIVKLRSITFTTKTMDALTQRLQDAMIDDMKLEFEQCGCSEKQFKQLASTVEQCPRIRTLNLGNMPLTKRSEQVLAATAKRATHLHSVHSTAPTTKYYHRAQIDCALNQWRTQLSDETRDNAMLVFNQVAFTQFDLIYLHNLLGRESGLFAAKRVQVKFVNVHIGPDAAPVFSTLLMALAQLNTDPQRADIEMESCFFAHNVCVQCADLLYTSDFTTKATLKLTNISTESAKGQTQLKEASDIAQIEQHFRELQARAERGAWEEDKAREKLVLEGITFAKDGKLIHKVLDIISTAHSISVELVFIRCQLPMEALHPLMKKIDDQANPESLIIRCQLTTYPDSQIPLKWTEILTRSTLTKCNEEKRSVRLRLTNLPITAEVIAQTKHLLSEQAAQQLHVPKIVHTTAVIPAQQQQDLIAGCNLHNLKCMPPEETPLEEKMSISRLCFLNLLKDKLNQHNPSEGPLRFRVPPVFTAESLEELVTLLASYHFPMDIYLQNFALSEDHLDRVYTPQRTIYYNKPGEDILKLEAPQQPPTPQGDGLDGSQEQQDIPPHRFTAEQEEFLATLRTKKPLPVISLTDLDITKDYVDTVVAALDAYPTIQFTLHVPHTHIKAASHIESAHIHVLFGNEETKDEYM